MHVTVYGSLGGHSEISYWYCIHVTEAILENEKWDCDEFKHLVAEIEKEVIYQSMSEENN